MSSVIPTAQNLPEGACFTSWQSTLDAFAAAMRVELPDEFGMIIISTDTPDPDYNGRIWFKVNDDNRILGIYSYDTDINDWVLADPFPYYFTDIGTDSALAITTGEDISLNSDILGRFFMVKVAATNTNTTVTFGVDSAPAAELRKNGTDAIEAGDLREDMVAILLFDGTYFQLLNPVQKTIPGVVESVSDPLGVPNVGSFVSFTHGLGARPSTWDVYFVCTTANNGFVIDDELPYISVTTGGGNDERPAFQVSINATEIKLVQANIAPTQRNMIHNSSGVDAAFTAGNWAVVFRTYLLTPAA